MPAAAQWAALRRQRTRGGAQRSRPSSQRALTSGPGVRIRSWNYLKWFLSVCDGPQAAPGAQAAGRPGWRVPGRDPLLAAPCRCLPLPLFVKASGQ